MRNLILAAVKSRETQLALELGRLRLQVAGFAITLNRIGKLTLLIGQFPGQKPAGGKVWIAL